MMKILASALFVMIATSQTSVAQGPPEADLRVLFYHGNKGLSSFVEPGPNGGYIPVADQRRNARLPAGSTVCVAVVNGHAINYAYSLTVSIDSSSATLPDLSKPVALLQTLFPQPDKPPVAADAPNEAVWKAVEQLVKAILPLDREIGLARNLVKASDNPEPPLLVGRPFDAKAGLLFARDSMARFNQSAGHFNDPKLKETHAAAVVEAKKAVAGDTLGKMAVAALAGYADGLRSERDQIWTAFSRADVVPQACGTTGKGRSTMTLAIAKKDTAVGKRSTSKDHSFRVVNDAPYDRPLVSIAPVALGVTAPGSPEFHVNNGVLRSGSARMHFRPGLIVALNRYAGGPFNVFGMSYGLGLGSGGGDKLISDVFFSVLFSVGDFIGSRSDAIRVGFGAGGSRLPDRVEGFEVNDPYPSTAGDLDDRITTEWKPALYLTFTLPSLNFGGSQ